MALLFSSVFKKKNKSSIQRPLRVESCAPNIPSIQRQKSHVNNNNIFAAAHALTHTDQQKLIAALTTQWTTQQRENLAQDLSVQTTCAPTSNRTIKDGPPWDLTYLIDIIDTDVERQNGQKQMWTRARTVGAIANNEAILTADNVNDTDSLGRTALFLVMRTGNAKDGKDYHFQAVQKLIAAKADVNVTCKSEDVCIGKITPLHSLIITTGGVTVRPKTFEMVKALVEAKASITPEILLRASMVCEVPELSKYLEAESTKK